MDRLNLLFVHEIDYKNKVIYEIHEFPEMLSAAGHVVAFLDYSEHSEIFKRFRRGSRETTSGRVIPGSKVNLITPARFGRGALGRLSSGFFSWFELTRFFIRNRPDVIINYAVPTYGIQIILLSKLFGVPLIHRALDVSHKIRESPWNVAIWFFEKFVFTFAGSLSANSPAMSEYMRRKGTKNKLIDVHLPPVELRHYAGKKSRVSRKSMGIKDQDFVMTYMGSFFYFSGLERVVTDFALLLQKRQDVHLLLIGGGELDHRLKNLVQELGIGKNVTFTGFVNYEDLPGLLQLADVGLNPMDIADVSNYALPHKVFQYLAAGLLVVSTDLKGLRSVLGNCRAVTFVNDKSEVVRVAATAIGKPALEKTVFSESLKALSPVKVLDEFQRSLYRSRK